MASDEHSAPLSRRIIRETSHLDISGIENSVLVTLADCHPNIWPSISTIVRRTKYSRRAVIDAIKTLESKELITITRKSGRPSNYVINVDRCTSCTGAPDALVQDTHGTGAPDALVPVRLVHPKKQIRDKEETNHVSKPRNGKLTLPRKSNKKAIRLFAKKTGFDDWYEIYGNKKSIDDAEKAWTFDIDENLRSQMVDITKDYLTRRSQAERAGEFVPTQPFPATFLRKRKWTDDFSSPGCSPTANANAEMLAMFEPEDTQ